MYSKISSAVVGKKWKALEMINSVGNDITTMTSIINLELKLTKDTNDRSEGHNLEVSVKFLPLSLLSSVL